MSGQFEQIQEFPTLTDSQRIQARRNAERNVIDKYARQPRRDDFRDYTASRFPGWFSWSIGAVLLIVALAAGAISGIRLYFAGRDYAAQTIDVETLTWAIGVSTFLAAELLVILATVAGQVYMRGLKRVISVIPILVGMVVAFVGNWEITQPSTTWGWVETIFPPVAVLSVAFFFEIALIPELERRQANDNAYRAAREDYDALVNAPDHHAKWPDTYGWALWELWAKIYRHEVDIQSVPQDVKRLIALREMSADVFFDDHFAESFRNHSNFPGGEKVTQRAVMQFLQLHPEADLWPGTRIAAETGASEATVSRARRKLQQNGHEG